MIPNLIILVLDYGSHLFWVKALIALCLLIIICLLMKFGLRRFRYKAGDLKAAGLNHRERRQHRATERRKRKEAKKPRKKIHPHF